MKDKPVLVLGVTSCIAIYKTLDVVSKLRDDYNIHVVMTENAMKMVSPVTFSSLSRNKVQYDTFSEKDWIAHISLADDADIFAIIPATANCVGKIAHGIGDDLLTTIAIAAHSRKIIAPAMNVNMWQNSIVQKNIGILQENNWEVIEPDYGILACGYEGKGKLASVEKIISCIKGEKPLKGKKIVVTAGGSIEDIDPVRFITNRSSGIMGIRFAEVARELGAEVILIHSRVETEVPKGIPCIFVRSALDTLNALEETLIDADMLVMAAAISDYRVENISEEKIKKDNDELVLTLIKNPDILKTLKKTKGKRIHIGFALETQNLMENAKKKLIEKGVDLLVANSTKSEISPFGEESSKVYILSKDGEIEDLPVMTKREIAKKVLLKTINLF